jgi:hypothetical protein
MEDGLSAPSAAEGQKALRGRKKKHEEGKGFTSSHTRGKQKKMQSKAHKSTALQPHHAKDKRKQTMRSESDDMHGLL